MKPKITKQAKSMHDGHMVDAILAIALGWDASDTVMVVDRPQLRPTSSARPSSWLPGPRIWAT